MKKYILSFLALNFLFVSTQSHAGLYADQLAKCLVESTTTQDRNQFVNWIFVMASKHPAVSATIDVSPAMIEESNKITAALMNDLLFNVCRNQTKQALQYEGEVAIFYGFSIFGQLAGRELFMHKNVSNAVSDINQYIDTEAMQKLLNN